MEETSKIGVSREQKCRDYYYGVHRDVAADCLLTRDEAEEEEEEINTSIFHTSSIPDPPDSPTGETRTGRGVTDH